MLRIILADHHAKARWALSTVLNEDADFELVGQTGDAESLFQLTANTRADVYLIDRDLPGSSIQDLIAQLHELEPRPTVIVMSANPEESMRVLRVGADAFVSKRDKPEWLIEILRSRARKT